VFLVSLNAFLRRRFGQGAAPQENRVIGLFAPHTEFTARFSLRPPARPMEPQPENKLLPPYIKEVPGPLPMHAATERPPHLMAPGSVVLQLPELQSDQPMPNGNDWIIPFPYVMSSYTKIALCQSRYSESWRLSDT
jgi:hypothetical protein